MALSRASVVFPSGYSPLTIYPRILGHTRITILPVQPARAVFLIGQAGVQVQFSDVVCAIRE